MALIERDGKRYAIWSLLKHAMGGHKSWERAWRDPEPKKTYNVIIVGGHHHRIAAVRLATMLNIIAEIFGTLGQCQAVEAKPNQKPNS